MPGALLLDMDDDILPPAKRARLEAADDDDDDEARFDRDDDFYDELPEQSNASPIQSILPQPAAKSTLPAGSLQTGFCIPGLGSLHSISEAGSISLVSDIRSNNGAEPWISEEHGENNEAFLGQEEHAPSEDGLESDLKHFPKNDDFKEDGDVSGKHSAHLSSLSSAQIPGLGMFPSQASFNQPGSPGAPPNANSQAMNTQPPATANSRNHYASHPEIKESGELDERETSFSFSDDRGQDKADEGPDAGSNPTVNPDAKNLGLDEDFLRAGKANVGDEGAEWQLDSDPMSSESSSDSDSDEDSDDSEAEGELLTAEEQARILMKAEVDQDGGAADDVILRTQNEQADEQYKRPDVVVTPDMKITELGFVESIVENLVVVKGNTSGEFQVLESGSILCLEDRTVIGAVAEPLGRVHEPRYSVGFALASEIAEMGITKGTKMFYVDQHSSYVFTQPLRTLKGTDASNQHDEEILEEEIEFSDDEKEAEYKRNVKAARKAARNDQSNARVPQRASAEPSRSARQPSQSVALDYDDEGETDMYTPLRRPTDYHNMIGPQAGVVQEHRSPYRNHKGRGGHGHSDRGRVDRGRGGRFDRGGRGGRFNDVQSRHDGQHHSHSRNRHDKRSKRSEANHRHDRPSGTQQSPPRYDPGSPHEGMPAPITSPLSKSQSSTAHLFGPSFSPAQGVQTPQSFTGQTNTVPSPGSMPFPFPFPPIPPVTLANLPAGAFVNPAFFWQQAPAQASPSPSLQTQAAAGAWNIQQVLEQLSQQSAESRPGRSPPAPTKDPRRR